MLETPDSNRKYDFRESSGAYPTSPSIGRSYVGDESFRQLQTEDLLRGSLATSQSIYSDVPRMSQLHFNSLASDSFLPKSSYQFRRSISPNELSRVVESNQDSSSFLEEPSYKLNPGKTTPPKRPTSRCEIPEFKSPSPIVKENPQTKLTQTFTNKAVDQPSSDLGDDETFQLNSDKQISIKRREEELELKIEQLFNKTKELESQMPSTRSQLRNLKKELKHKLRKFKALAKEEQENKWTDEVLGLVSENSRHSTKKCSRHRKKSKRATGVQADTSVKVDVALSPIKVHRRENSTATQGSWGFPKPESPDSDIEPLDLLPEILSRQNSSQSISSLMKYLRTAERFSTTKYQTSIQSDPLSSERSNPNLVAYATTSPRHTNKKDENSQVVELKARHAEYKEVSKLMEKYQCSVLKIMKTFNRQLQKSMQQSWLKQSASTLNTAPEATFYFYVAPIVILEKIFNSPLGFASVFSPVSSLALTCEPTGETYELLCLACNTERSRSRWQTEAQYVLPVYLVEYQRH